ASAGIRMVTAVCDDVSTATGTPPSLTWGAVDPTLRLVPDTVMVVPATPAPGVTVVMAGRIVSVAALVRVPTGFVIVSGPVAAPFGTITRSDVAVTWLGVAAAPPANRTWLLRDNPLPV